jgi:hypothetical protein
MFFLWNGQFYLSDLMKSKDDLAVFLPLSVFLTLSVSMKG